MSLTDVEIRKAKPGEKPIKLSDVRGLYLEIAPGGGKWWRLKYRFEGKEKRLSLGVYPDVGLKEARDRRDDARKLLADGVDPSSNRKAQKAAKAELGANTFEVIAREWLQKFAGTKTQKYWDGVLKRFERDIFPWLGGKPVAEISSKELLATVRRIEARGAVESAHRALSSCGQVFRYAVATGRAERDPSGALKGAIPPAQVKHMAATTDPKRLAEILRDMDGYRGTLIVRCALRLAPLVFVRPGELRKAHWADFNLEAAEWRYHVTKVNAPLIVPLCTQAVALLKEIQPLTSNGTFVFPGARSKARPMSENAILAALRRLGITKEEMSGHGFRAVARTLLDEVLGFRPDFIEHQLSHVVKDPNGRAYNRTTHLDERRKMMQAWADYLDSLRGQAAGTDPSPEPTMA